MTQPDTSNHIDTILTRLGITTADLEPGDIVTGAVIVLRVINLHNDEPSIYIADGDGAHHADTIGLLRAASAITENSQGSCCCDGRD